MNIDMLYALIDLTRVVHDDALRKGDPKRATTAWNQVLQYAQELDETSSLRMKPDGQEMQRLKLSR